MGRPVTRTPHKSASGGKFRQPCDADFGAFRRVFGISRSVPFSRRPDLFLLPRRFLRKFPQAGIFRNANIVVMIVARFAATSNKVHNRAFGAIFFRIDSAKSGVLDQGQQHRLIIMFLRAPSAIGPHFERADDLLRFGIDKDLRAEPEAMWRKHDRPVAGDFGQ